MKTIVLAILFFFVPSAFAGDIIRVIGMRHPWIDACQELIPKFEEETGIRVVLETYTEDRLSEKLDMDFRYTGGEAFDVFCTRPPQEGRYIASQGWYEDLAPYIAADPEYDFSDFPSFAVEATRFSGKQICIPLVNETELLFYRKDILAKNNVSVPQTFDELRQAAHLLNDAEGDFYGFVARGQAAALVTQFSSFLYGFGSDYFDSKTGKSLINTPEFLEAVQFYADLLRLYGPPNASEMHWMEASKNFMMGGAALYTEASSLYPLITDPDESEYADKIGVAVFPAGPRAHRTYTVTSWGLAISAGSRKKNSAWKFVRYMTDKARTRIFQGEYKNLCSRISVYQDPDLTNAFPADLIAALKHSMEIGIERDRPAVESVREARLIIGGVVAAALRGDKYFNWTVEQAQEHFQALLDLEKKHVSDK